MEESEPAAADRTIASRPSQEQVTAIVEFMERHPALALGQMRGLEGRDESRKLWLQLTRLVNNLQGPTRPMKSWIKYWADKKSAIRSKVEAGQGDLNNLTSNFERRIWDRFLADDRPSKTKTRTSKKRNGSSKKNGGTPKTRPAKVKTEHFLEELAFETMDVVEGTDHGVSFEDTDHGVVFEDHGVSFEDTDHGLAFDSELSAEERQAAVMDKLMKVMSDQAAAMSQLANASFAQSQAMDRLADASHIQARALDRIAATFESTGSNVHDIRNAIVGIDSSMKRYYSTSPT